MIVILTLDAKKELAGLSLENGPLRVEWHDTPSNDKTESIHSANSSRFSDNFGAAPPVRANNANDGSNWGNSNAIEKSTGNWANDDKSSFGGNQWGGRGRRDDRSGGYVGHDERMKKGRDGPPPPPPKVTGSNVSPLGVRRPRGESTGFDNNNNNDRSRGSSNFASKPDRAGWSAPAAENKSGWGNSSPVTSSFTSVDGGSGWDAPTETSGGGWGDLPAQENSNFSNDNNNNNTNTNNPPVSRPDSASSGGPSWNDSKSDAAASDSKRREQAPVHQLPRPPVIPRPNKLGRMPAKPISDAVSSNSSGGSGWDAPVNSASGGSGWDLPLESSNAGAWCDDTSKETSTENARPKSPLKSNATESAPTQSVPKPESSPLKIVGSSSKATVPNDEVKSSATSDTVAQSSNDPVADGWGEIDNSVKPEAEAVKSNWD